MVAPLRSRFGLASARLVRVCFVAGRFFCLTICNHFIGILAGTANDESFR